MKSLFLIAFCVMGSVTLAEKVHAQASGAGPTVDSLHVAQQSMDSLLRLDSIQQAMIAKEEARIAHMQSVASQREIDLTNDGVPEVLRISGVFARNIDDTKLTFTIRSGKKTLYTDTWKAKGYFDTIDHLTDSVKRRRLSRIVTVFFANENFVVLDSTEFTDLIHQGTPADLMLGSPESCELFRDERVMFSVFASRELWYGLVWLPSQKRFIKAWRN